MFCFFLPFYLLTIGIVAYVYSSNIVFITISIIMLILYPVILDKLTTSAIHQEKYKPSEVKFDFRGDVIYFYQFKKYLEESNIKS